MMFHVTRNDDDSGGSCGSGSRGAREGGEEFCLRKWVNNSVEFTPEIISARFTRESANGGGKAREGRGRKKGRAVKRPAAHRK